MEIVSRVMDLYARIDKAVAEFQLTSGLRCPPGCGNCCQTTEVQTSILEMLPVAHEMLRNAQAAEWMDRLAAAGDSNECILYSARSLPGAAGKCSFYKWRPTLCRMFGYAAVRNRAGAMVLSVCRHIRQTHPQGAAAAAALAGQAPGFVHFSTQVYALDPALGARLMPINTALRRAVERLGLNISLRYEQTLKENTAA